jgi:predicted phage terminase large subunit-like protein
VIEIPAYTGVDKRGVGVGNLDHWQQIVMRLATPLFDGSRFNIQELAALRATMGDELFGAKYMQRPPRSGGLIFPEIFPTWIADRFTDGEETGITVGDLWIPVPSFRTPQGVDKFLVLGCDTAGSESASADFTACVLLACWWEYDAFAKIFLLRADVLHAWYDRIETTGVVDHIARIARSIPGALVGYESQGEGRAQLAFLKRDYPDLNVTEIKTSTSKRARATPCGAAAKSGRLRLPVRADWMREFRRQVSKFTGYGGSIKDDIPDALSHAWNLASMTAAPLPPRSGGERRIRGHTGSF